MGLKVVKYMLAAVLTRKKQSQKSKQKQLLRNETFTRKKVFVNTYEQFSTPKEVETTVK